MTDQCIEQLLGGQTMVVACRFNQRDATSERATIESGLTYID